MVDLVIVAFWVAPLVYVAGYVYALFKYMIPWLSVPVTEIVKLTVLQLIATFFFFTLGLGLFITAIIIFCAVASSYLEHGW